MTKYRYMDRNSVRTTINALFPGLSIKYHDGPNTMFATADKTLLIPNPWDNMTYEEYCLYFTGIMHEMMHNTKPHNDIFDSQFEDPLLAKLANIVADMNIDYRCYVDGFRGENYSGRQEIYDAGMYEFHVTKSKDIPEKKPTSIEDTILTSFLGFNIRSKQDYLSGLVGAPVPFEKYNETYLDKLMAYAEQFNTCDHSPERDELLLKVLKEVFDYDPPNTTKNETGKSKGSKSSGSSEGSEESLVSESQQNSGESKTASASQASVVKYKDIKHMDDHGEGTRPSSGLTILYDEDDYKGYSERYIGLPLTVRSPESHNTQIQHNIETQLRTHGRSVSRAIARYWATETRKTITPNKRTGRLHAPSIHKIYSSKSDTDREKVFYNKSSKHDIDTSITLLVDASGSMAGSKTHIAAASTVMLNEICQKLHIQTRIYTFSTGWSGNTLIKVKAAHKKLGEDKLISELSGSFPHGGNSDGVFVRYCYEELLRDKTNKKILIVLSDGQPSGACESGDDAKYLYQMTKMIESQGIVDLYGVGIQDTSVKHFYNKHVIIKDSEQLPEAILNIAKNGVFI